MVAPDNGRRGHADNGSFARVVASTDPADDTAWSRLVARARGRPRALRGREQTYAKPAKSGAADAAAPPGRQEQPAAAWEEGPAAGGRPYVPDDFLYGVPVGACDAEIRNGFLRKVYALVSMQLLTTFLVSLWFMVHAPTRTFVLRRTWLSFVSAIFMFVFLFACAAYRARHPHNLLCLAGFTLSATYSVAVACASFMAVGAGYVVLEAFLLSALLTVGLSVFTLRSKRDFGFLGNGLQATLLALLGGYLVCWLLSTLLGLPELTGLLWFLLAVAGAATFSAYIVYDTWAITQRMTPDMYVQAAIELYLDIINLFLNCLRGLSYIGEGC